MIIKEVKLSKPFLFLKEKLFILTDHGKIPLNAEFDKSLINELNIKLNGFKIESSEDFVKLKQKLKDLENDKYSLIEKAIFNSISGFWRFFNPSTAQIPRPICVVLKNDNGAREFVVFSLNANNFEVVLNSARRIRDFIKNKLSDLNNANEEDLLMLIKEAVDSEHEAVDFEIRIGIVFNNFNNGRYEYNHNNLDEKQQLDFVSKLITNYHVVYVENPFHESDLESYDSLTKKHKSVALICMNSKINEYNNGIDKQAFNSLVVKFTDIPSFKFDVTYFKDHNINVIAEGDSDIMSMAVGLGVPLVKINSDESSTNVSRRLGIIADEILKFRKTTN